MEVLCGEEKSFQPNGDRRIGAFQISKGEEVYRELRKIRERVRLTRGLRVRAWGLNYGKCQPVNVLKGRARLGVCI